MAFSANPQILLNRHNYCTWCEFINGVLLKKGLDIWINRELWPDTKGYSEEFKFKLDCCKKKKAAGIIKGYCNSDTLRDISVLTDLAEIWDTLKKVNDIPKISYKSYTIALFDRIKRGHEEDLPSFIARFEEAYRMVRDSEETIQERHRCYKLLRSLPEEYESSRD